VLFGVGGVTALIEGARKLVDASHGVDHPRTALVLIGVSLVFEASSFAFGARKARRRLAPGVGLWAGLRESRDADLTIVVFEDSGALVGLSLAVVGVAFSAWTGSGLPDAMATIGIGLLLCVIAGVLAVEMHALLIGEPASRLDLDRLRAAVESVPGVDKILNLRTEHIGPEDLLVCMKVEFAEPFDDLIERVDEIERRVHDAVPSTLTCYVEPDRFDAGRDASGWT
jgi:divalent metal cation (Fe/Co/Zn/Cd) transporter